MYAIRSYYAEGADIIARYLADWRELKTDTPCIVILNSQQDFVFKLTTLNEDGTIRLKSLNPVYEPYTVDAADVIEIWRFYAYTSREFPEATPDMDTLLTAIKKLETKIDRLNR